MKTISISGRYEEAANLLQKGAMTNKKTDIVVDKIALQKSHESSVKAGRDEGRIC